MGEQVVKIYGESTMQKILHSFTLFYLILKTHDGIKMIAIYLLRKMEG